MYNEMQKINYTVDEKDFESAVSKLSKYNQGLSLLNQDYSKYAYGMRYTEPFQKLRIQNSNFENCTFRAAFERTNLSGSRLNNCTFEKIEIANSNFQYSNLKNCEIKDCTIEGSNFADCYLDNVSYSNNLFVGNNFSYTHFNKCNISGGELLSTSLEFSIFTDSTFRDLRLANLSMEYSEFDNVHMNNVILPFAQLPFIFNGLDYILNTNDKIAISANMKDCKSISVEEYVETFNDWKIFLFKKSLYFPLSNILLAEGNKEEALECILCGVIMTICNSDYRTLKYLCKLAAAHPCVSKSDCLKVYRRIKELIDSNLLNNEQYYNYMIHMQDIKNILVENPKCNPQLSVSLQTNILPEERKKLMYIVEFLDSIITKEYFGIDSKTISMKHNSPYEILLIVIGSIFILKEVTELIKTIISGIKVTTEDIISIRSICNYKSQSDKLDIEIKKATLEKERLEAEKLSLEIEQFQKEMQNAQVELQVTQNINEVNKIYIA